jgi:chromosome segregation ATPase
MARVATFAVLALLLVSSLAVKTRLTAAQEKQIKELKKEKWGDILFTMAELQIQSQGPFEELLDAVSALVGDISDKIEDNDNAYTDRSNAHQSEVTRLEGVISDTNVAIANTENVLNNILYPTLEELQNRLQGYHNNVDENNAYMEKITFERNEAHEAYLDRVEDHNGALAAVDECLGILEQITGPLSLIQVKKVQNSIHKVTQKLKRGVEETMVKALITLASNEFADHSAILRVVHALEDVKDSVLDSLEQEHAEEARSLDQYNNEITERTKDNKRLAREINNTKGEIDGTERRIAEKETFLSVKRGDLVSFNAELEAENAAFEEATNFYEDVRAELVREQSVAQDVSTIISNAGFSSSISGNIGF